MPKRLTRSNSAPLPEAPEQVSAEELRPSSTGWCPYSPRETGTRGNEMPGSSFDASRFELCRQGVRSVELLGSYSNPDIVSRLERILAGAGRDRLSTRTVRSPRRIQRKLTPDEVSDLVVLRGDGWEIDALAQRFGIGRSTVMEHLKRAGVTGRRWQGRTLSPEQLEEGGRLYETGLNLIAVAEQFDVDRRYLRRALPEAGFPIRRAGQQKRQSDRSRLAGELDRDVDQRVGDLDRIRLLAVHGGTDEGNDSCVCARRIAVVRFVMSSAAEGTFHGEISCDNDDQDNTSC